MVKGSVSFPPSGGRQEARAGPVDSEPVEPRLHGPNGPPTWPWALGGSCGPRLLIPAEAAGPLGWGARPCCRAPHNPPQAQARQKQPAAWATTLDLAELQAASLHGAGVLWALGDSTAVDLELGPVIVTVAVPVFGVIPPEETGSAPLKSAVWGRRFVRGLPGLKKPDGGHVWLCGTCTAQMVGEAAG